MTKATDNIADWENLSCSVRELRARVEALEQLATASTATGTGAETDGLLDRMLNTIENERGNGCYQQSRCAIKTVASWLICNGEWQAANKLTDELKV